MKRALYDISAKICDLKPEVVGFRSKFICLMTTDLLKLSNFWAFSGLV